ncbi:MAG: hypothetical protein IJP97_05405, partial [Synergistaceae bacterium]|nr:hypothetical protein [Synergistaceae bacterium]
MAGSFNNIQAKSILVVGDIMLDAYYTGDISRISPEAPVPVFKKEKERSVLGGAANVAANLIAAEQNVSLMSLIGEDLDGAYLKSKIAKMGINTELIIADDKRSTTVKTRFLAGHNQQVIRMDVEDAVSISDELRDKMLRLLSERISTYDLILLSDYMKGLLTYEFTQSIINIANDNNVPVLVDVKDRHVEKYSNAYLLKPNL